MRITELVNLQTARNQQLPHLYLDMDGVQADFFTAWANWHGNKFGMSHVERYKDIGSKEQREQSISELSAEGPEFIQNFFATLPTLSGGQKLVRWLTQNRIPFTVLSAPLRGMHAPSIAGKKTWLDAHNPGTSGTAIFTGDKARMATQGGQPNILVDDFKKYINAWDNAGGIGILYRDDMVDDVISQLEQIYKPQTDSLNETTSAGCIATVAQPLGELQQRLPHREKGKYKNSAPVVR